ncbi:MAG: adenylate/guanylate cyclase domain-containing protein [Anaerolineaceae bacterium]|nr:adenylate/guanylate cyclase domain-containing protein [Anaerolineaceae bacterium]
MPIKAATMFADLSGFTQMAETLSVNGARGTEALSRALLMTFTALINAIHDAGGAVSHFHGDAMMIYFPDSDGQAASRALASAQFMQRLMQTNFAQVNMIQPNDGYALSIKIGVGYGRCVELLVGDADNMEFVLAGQAIDEAVAAQMQAQAGQVVASQHVLKAAGLPAPEPFRLVDELPPVPAAHEGFFWEAYDSAALLRLVTAVPAFIPPSLFERLQDRSSQSISEHRSVTSMFVQFEGIDFDDPAVDAGAQLQTYYHWAWQMVQRYGGANSRVNRVLTGDKGNQLHILFGAPIAPDAPDQALRCALAMQQQHPDFIHHQRIGLTAGRVFAGAVGSLNRREYTVVGRMVNLSARLTQICPPGGILVDAETAVRVQPQIILKSLPAVPLKGHREPVAIFQVVGEQTAVTQAQARFAQWQQPPAGREKELKQLHARMNTALRGQGGLVTIHGTHGSGQMPFLAAGVRHWLEAGGHALVGVCQQHTSDVPYAPWVSVWRDFFELSPEMSLTEQQAQVANHIERLTPELPNALALWRELLGTPMRATALLLDLPAVVRQMRLFKLVIKSLQQSVGGTAVPHRSGRPSPGRPGIARPARSAHPAVPGIAHPAVGYLSRQHPVQHTPPQPRHHDPDHAERFHPQASPPPDSGAAGHRPTAIGARAAPGAARPARARISRQPTVSGRVIANDALAKRGGGGPEQVWRRPFTHRRSPPVANARLRHHLYFAALPARPAARG